MYFISSLVGKIFCWNIWHGTLASQLDTIEMTEIGVDKWSPFVQPLQVIKEKLIASVIDQQHSPDYIHV